MEGGGICIAGLLVVGFVLLCFFISFIPLGLWIKAMSAGVSIGPMAFVGMRLKKVSQNKIVDTLIKVKSAGLGLTRNELEAHYLAGGSVDAVCQALIEADKANIHLNFAQAAAIDLAGRNVLEAVTMSINPKVIKTPPIAGVAKDGIQVRATARITVRANIQNLIGGAGEDTVIARVGEGIVSTIGSSETHKLVMENPHMITQNVLKRGLDRGTAFEILSIDIADVDIGRNIGAQLQIDQSNADKLIAQAQAEKKRVEAVAEEAEMKARVEDMRAKVIEAEAKVPLGLSAALRQGRLGIEMKKQKSLTSNL